MDTLWLDVQRDRPEAGWTHYEASVRFGNRAAILPRSGKKPATTLSNWHSGELPIDASVKDERFTRWFLSLGDTS